MSRVIREMTIRELSGRKSGNEMKNREIERKWLVKSTPANLEGFRCLKIEQAYLNQSPAVRVRREDDRYYMTYKASADMEGNSELSHTEYNMELNRESYQHLCSKRDGILISKKRYLIPLDDVHIIELDVFDKPISPLVIAEIEFEDEDDARNFVPPDWFGEDVTCRKEYRNSWMSNAYQNSPAL